MAVDSDILLAAGREWAVEMMSLFEPEEKPMSNREIPLKASDFLLSAQEALLDRAASRDSGGERSMARTVAAFNAVYGTELTEVQGWHFMELLKMVRGSQGAFRADDYTDGAAYAALAGEAAANAPPAPDPNLGRWNMEEMSEDAPKWKGGNIE